MNLLIANGGAWEIITSSTNYLHNPAVFSYVHFLGSYRKVSSKELCFIIMQINYQVFKSLLENLEKDLIIISFILGFNWSAMRFHVIVSIQPRHLILHWHIDLYEINNFIHSFFNGITSSSDVYSWLPAFKSAPASAIVVKSNLYD